MSSRAKRWVMSGSGSKRPDSTVAMSLRMRSFSTRMSPGPWKTVARIVPTVLICVLLVQSACASSRAGQDPRRTGGPPGYLAWLGLHPLDDVRYQSSCGDPWGTACGTMAASWTLSPLWHEVPGYIEDGASSLPEGSCGIE